MAKRRRGGINANDLTIARAQQKLKYDPQVNAVRDLYGQAKDQYVSDITAAQGAAQSAVKFAKQELPKVRKIYSGATNAAEAAQQDVQTAFGNVGAAADVFKAATAREQGGQLGRIAEASARARTDLKERQASALAGKSLAYKQAQGDYSKTRGSLSQKLIDIAGEQGNYLDATLGSLRNARQANKTKVNVANIGAKSRESVAAANAGSREKVAAANRDAADRRAAAKETKSNRRPGSERGKLSDDVNAAFSFASKNVPKAGVRFGLPRPKMADILLHGQVVEKNGDLNSAIPKFGQLAASIALDMAYDGHVSRANAARLHDLGYKVSDIANSRSFNDWRKTPAGRAWAKAQNAPKASKPKPVGVFAQGPFG
jgi:hypothetical protein